MKFVASLLTAAALLASCISSLPLDQPHSTQVLTVRTGSKVDYGIAEAIKMMFENKKDDFQAVCTTDGGWEVAAQVLLERQFQHDFNLRRKTQIREVHVYKDSAMAADFVLPDTDERNGIIIELKCENKNSNAKTQMKNKVHNDMEKMLQLKPEFKGYKFVVAAMAYSPEAEKVLTENLHLEFIPGAEIEIEESVYSGSSQGGSQGGSQGASHKSDSDTEMKDASDTKSDSGKSDSSSKSIRLRVYQKEVDASDVAKNAGTRTSDRIKGSH